MKQSFSRPERIGELIDSLHDRSVADFYWAGIVSVGIAIQVYTLWRQRSSLESNQRHLMYDSVIFEYIGWFLARGGRLYVDIWEIKPPLPFEITAAVAVVFRWDLYLYHLVNVSLTSAAAVGTATLVGLLIHELSERPGAAFLAGVTMFAMPTFHWRAGAGFKAKYFVLFFGLLTIFFALRHRSFASGLSGAASVWTWQFAIIFPLLALGIIFKRPGDNGVARMVAGSLIGTVLVLLPVVFLWNALGAMIAEVILAPLVLLDAGGATVSFRITKALELLDMAFPLALLGGYGILWGAIRSRRDTWWIAVGGVWFAFVLLFLDLDAYPDLYPVFVFATLGIGLLTGMIDNGTRVLAGLLVVMVLFNVLTVGAFGDTGRNPYQGTYTITETPEPVTTSDPIEGQIQGFFWNPRPAKSCHIFGAADQRTIVSQIGTTMRAETCGDVESYWYLFVEKYFDH